MPRHAVAALSARAMAESLAAAGGSVIALDAFGDRDTVRASEAWLPIGRDDRRGLDRGRLLAALRTLAGRGDVDGWIAGSGFEAEPDLLEEAAALLPLIGSPPAAVREVREPRRFFETLRAHDIDHPDTRFAPPADPEGWLRKDARGTGGWQVLPAQVTAAGPSDSRYWQRSMPGTPMSATFLASSRRTRLLGFNQLLTRRFGLRPHVYCGAIGPVELPPAAAAAARRALHLLATQAGLRGLGSLDFLLHGGRVLVLEVNPRPPATLELYRERLPGGPMQAHLRACLDDRVDEHPDDRADERLPAPPAAGVDGATGSRIVFARRALRIDAAAADWLASQADLHDLPAAGQELAAGDPLCSVTAQADEPSGLRERLLRRRRELLDHLETPR